MQVSNDMVSDLDWKAAGSGFGLLLRTDGLILLIPVAIFESILY